MKPPRIVPTIRNTDTCKAKTDMNPGCPSGPGVCTLCTLALPQLRLTHLCHLCRHSTAQVRQMNTVVCCIHAIHHACTVVTRATMYSAQQGHRHSIPDAAVHSAKRFMQDYTSPAGTSTPSWHGPHLANEWGSDHNTASQHRHCKAIVVYKGHVSMQPVSTCRGRLPHAPGESCMVIFLGQAWHTQSKPSRQLPVTRHAILPTK
jgi:hypothetical protein